MWRKVLPLVAVFFFPFVAESQEARPIIRFSPFFTEGIGIEETRFIESIIQAYLADAGEVINFFDASSSEASLSGENLFPDSWTKAPDYVLTGSIYLERDNRIFTLEIHNTGTGETTRSTSVHKTVGDLALKARSMLEGVFAAPASKGSAGETDMAERPERITESVIAGTWRGETGIEIIRLQQGGRGIAIFSSGAQMNLRYTIEDNTLKIRQDSPNVERYYYPLPYGVAQQLSAEADPMRWELLLYSGGTHLKGVKISTDAKIENNILVELIPETAKDSLWVRSGR